MAGQKTVIMDADGIRRALTRIAFDHAAARDSGDAVSKNSNVIFPVHLAEADADPFLVRGRQVFADIVRADGELAVAAVDQNGELDAACAARRSSVRSKARLLRSSSWT